MWMSQNYFETNSKERQTNKGRRSTKSGNDFVFHFQSVCKTRKNEVEGKKSDLSRSVNGGNRCACHIYI